MKKGRYQLITVTAFLVAILWLTVYKSHTPLRRSRPTSLVRCTTEDVSAQTQRTSSPTPSEKEQGRYAIFSSNTPDGYGHRPYDYAFYLPLTALAWQRIGFGSIVVIIGTRDEWQRNPLLSHVLNALEMRSVHLKFVDAPPENRRMLSQTVRLLVANMEEWTHSDDYFITSDSDLWPLRQAHYTQEANKSLVLVHSDCCHPFTFQNKSYRMIPMSNIGASAATWRQIMNTNHSIANDCESILKYYEEMFGPSVREEVGYASAGWNLDQRMVSIRVQEWIDSRSENLVYKKTDTCFSRIDRSNWNIPQTSLEAYYDAHLPESGYIPDTWKQIRPLVSLMFGDGSWQLLWADEYTDEFYQILQSR